PLLRCACFSDFPPPNAPRTTRATYPCMAREYGNPANTGHLRVPTRPMRQIIARKPWSELPHARRKLLIRELLIRRLPFYCGSAGGLFAMAHASALRPARPFSALLLTALCLALAGCGINTIPTYEQNAKAAWSEVLNQYKRRADLIPNLVETVKGFADQERTVLTDVVEARAKATQVQANIPADILTNPEAMQKFQDAQNQLGGALGRLLAVVERYPDI